MGIGELVLGGLQGVAGALACVWVFSASRGVGMRRPRAWAGLVGAWALASLLAIAHFTPEWVVRSVAGSDYATTETALARAGTKAGALAAQDGYVRGALDAAFQRNQQQGLGLLLAALAATALGLASARRAARQ